MDEIFLVLLRGLALGAIYAIIAMSFNVVYKSSGVLNFAQGNIFILGALAAAFLTDYVSGILSWFLFLLVAAIVVSVILYIQGMVTIGVSAKKDSYQSWLVSTMASSVIIGALILMFQGASTVYVSPTFGKVEAFGAKTPITSLIAIVLMFAWYVILEWFYRKTMLGLSISALSQDIHSAKSAGLPVKKLQLLAFGISGLIVGSAGYALAPVLVIGAESGINYVINGFIAAVVGGVGSNSGSILGGLLLGSISMMTAFTLGGEFQLLTALAILIFVLMLRPQGLFGRTAARTV
ncbi:branched-chain amino acid ABC transporter permease [uncultured Marinobacter sp.]|uniref:branched-chain amino acid ABC transporter permease n=1 Tax=uncultured Marinobacter sp. TaxID=187379 RepID=UPI0026356F77|nr:branched-chain amino acid ABC transporter permease [uncultured Marinobacter sp.]